MSLSASKNEIETLVQRARIASSAGENDVAMRLFLSVIEIDPFNINALNYIAASALVRGEADQAVDLMRRASSSCPEDMTIRYNLAVALEKAGHFDDARQELLEILRVNVNAFEVELTLGRICDVMGDRPEAIRHYFGAVKRARAAGVWLNDASVPTWLHPHLVRAMQIAQNGYRELLYNELAVVRGKFGERSVERVEEAVQIHLNEMPARYADQRQRPTFFYVPGLAAIPVYNNNRFPWIASLEEASLLIQEEVAGLMRENQIHEPFNRYSSPEQAAASLAGTRGEPAWKAKFFFRHGERYVATHNQCPNTSAALERVDLCKIADHAPEVCFSLLSPGTHILPHRGVTNARLVCHLALIVPDDCALSVAGRELNWEVGKCFVFDDTYEHEAWNRSNDNRIVLLMDVWNPDLTPAERAALAAVIAAIGVFNRSCGIV